MSELYKREPEFSIDKSKLLPGTQIEKQLDGTLKRIRLTDGSFVSVEELKELADAKQTVDNLHAQELADAIKGGGKVDLKKIIIPLNARKPDYIIPMGKKEPDYIIPMGKKEPGMLGNEYPLMAEDGSMHLDMEGLQQANASDYDAHGFFKLEKIEKRNYITPILPSQDE